MQKLQTGLFLMFCLLLTVPFTSMAQDESVTLKSFVGKVEVRSPSSVVYRPARIGMPIKSGWGIRTYVESEAELAFATGTIIKIGENSVVDLTKAFFNQQASTSATSVKVATGQVWANVKKLTNQTSKFDFETPTATASIRGTRLGINVGKDGTAIDVYEGLVMVRSKGSDKDVPVSTKNRALIAPGSALVDVKQFEGTPKPDSTQGKNALAAPKDPFAQDPPAAVDSTKATPSPDSLAKKPVQDTVARKAPLDSLKVPVTKTDSIPAAASLSGASKPVSANVEYHVPLVMNISGVTDNMEVTASTLPINVTVSENAKYSVNGKEGVSSVELAPGNNVLAFKAWDPYNNTSTRSISVVYKKMRKLALTLTGPVQSQTFTEPMIIVTGTTVPNAKVTVNGQGVTVGGSGAFSMRMPIPDEPMDYEISVVAKLDYEELSLDRTVTYQPVKKPLTLDISSPTNGQIIKTKLIRIVAKTSVATPPVSVKVNGRSASVSTSGVISAEIPISEQNIGSYQIEISADDGTREISKSLNLTIDITAPQVNTSVPSLLMAGIGASAVKIRTFGITVLDRTPDDQLTVVMQNNSTKEEVTLSPGGRQSYNLDEGLNRYSIRVLDKAQNVGNVISGTVYYLPGPLQIDLIDPSNSPVTINDLPPMPKNTVRPKFHLVVEIDDNIGTVPEAIKYCRVSGAGVDILMRNDSKYRYSADIDVLNGSRSFLIKTEDLAGNIGTKTLDIDIRR